MLICSVIIIIANNPVFAAGNPDVTSGLNTVNAATLAGKIIGIAVGIGALAGSVAAIVLVYLGLKLKSGNERARADTIEQIKYVFIGLGIVGLAVAIVSFFASIVKM